MCDECDGSGWLMITDVITLEVLEPDETPPYMSPCHACEKGRALVDTSK